MSLEQSAVVVKNLYKGFKLPHDQQSGLKQLVINFAKRKKGYEIQKVLEDVTFDIKKGEFFGIVGRNGSGKSTLLKLLAGIYAPDSGLVQVNGTLTPFIELGVGFNPELTGRENIFLNGALLGFSRSEMNDMYGDIVAFAELDRFMDQKLKNYSSGMQVRLAFSIAIRAKSDILLIDEVLAVGDQIFQKKCYDYFRQLKKEKRTVILVTHDMDAVKNYCTRALLLDKSQLVTIGTPGDVADEYSLRMVSPNQQSITSEDRRVKNINVESISSKNKVHKDKILDIAITFRADENLKYFVAYSLKREGVSISESSSQFDGKIKLGSGDQKIILQIDVSALTTGEYELDVAFYDVSNSELIAYKNSAYTQLISNANIQYGGYFIASSKWSTNLND